MQLCRGLDGQAVRASTTSVFGNIIVGTKKGAGHLALLFLELAAAGNLFGRARSSEGDRAFPEFAGLRSLFQSQRAPASFEVVPD